MQTEPSQTISTSACIQRTWCSVYVGIGKATVPMNSFLLIRISSVPT